MTHGVRGVEKLGYAEKGTERGKGGASERSEVEKRNAEGTWWIRRAGGRWYWEGKTLEPDASGLCPG